MQPRNAPESGPLGTLTCAVPWMLRQHPLLKWSQLSPKQTGAHCSFALRRLLSACSRSGCAMIQYYVTGPRNQSTSARVSAIAGDCRRVIAQLSMRHMQSQMLRREQLLWQQICKPAPDSCSWCGVDVKSVCIYLAFVAQRACSFVICAVVEAGTTCAAPWNHVCVCHRSMTLLVSSVRS